MPGLTDLNALLAGMSATLAPGTFVFATVRGAPPPGTAPLMVFAEDEGTTLVLAEDDAARAGIAATYPCRRITLRVHSSLEAVGFLAAITAELARLGISVNPVSAYHHDHLFVPADRAEEALSALAALAAASGAGRADVTGNTA